MLRAELQRHRVLLDRGAGATVSGTLGMPIVPDAALSFLLRRLAISMNFVMDVQQFVYLLMHVLIAVRQLVLVPQPAATIIAIIVTVIHNVWVHALGFHLAK